jgi:hypothetical protein
MIDAPLANTDFADALKSATAWLLLHPLLISRHANTSVIEGNAGRLSRLVNR